jgi:flagellar basal body-associated protein FliL
MSEYKEIRDDQIRVINSENLKKKPSRTQWIIIISVLTLLFVGIIIGVVSHYKKNKIQ